MSWSKLINTLLYILLFGFLFGSIVRCNREQDKISILEQNYLAARDTIEVLEMKNGDLLYEKSLYILNEKELTSQLNIAKEDIKDLKNKLNSSLNTISKIQGTIQYDTITIPGDTIKIIEPNTYVHQFDYNDQWLKLSGETTINNNFAQISIYNISVPVDLVVGTTKNNKFFVESKNPYLQINSIEGAVLENTVKKSHWHFGVGFGLGVQYGLTHKQFDWGPQINCGLMYNF